MADIKVQVCLYAFDCLYKNGEVLVDQPLMKRREALYSAIEEKPGELFYATAKARTACLIMPQRLSACICDSILLSHCKAAVSHHPCCISCMPACLGHVLSWLARSRFKLGAAFLTGSCRVLAGRLA